MQLNRFLFFTLLSALSLEPRAQDESTFRDIFQYSDREKRKAIKEKNYRIKARSNRHFFDFTGDGRPESFYSAKLDGEDWFILFNDKEKEVFRYQLDPIGPWSRLYRVEKRSLSDSSDVYLLHFYEGISRYINFKGTARVYFLTIDKNNLKTASVYKGPILWDETRDFRDHYHQRKYEVSLLDLDASGTRDVIVKYGRMSRVFSYKGKGKWVTLDDQQD